MGRQSKPKSISSKTPDASQKLEKSIKDRLRKRISKPEKVTNSEAKEKKPITKHILDKNQKPVPHTEPLNPPYVDDHFQETCNVHRIQVNQNNKIQSKVSQALSPLLQTKNSTNKREVVALLARAPGANKCISVAEITKRECIRSGQEKLYQYTGYWTRLEQVALSTLETKDEKTELEDESDDAFQPMTPHTKIRNIPCLVIYLTTKPVVQLKQLYSEHVTT